MVRLGGPFGLSRGDNPEAERRTEGRRILKKEHRRLGELFGEGESFLLSALNAREQGFDEAREATLDFGRATRSQALELGQQAQAATSRQLAGSGLGGTSLVGPMSQGVSSQVASQLASIDAEVSRVLGALAIGQGESRAQGLEQLGQFQLGRFQTESETFYSPLFNLFTGTGRTQSGVQALENLQNTGVQLIDAIVPG